MRNHFVLLVGLLALGGWLFPQPAQAKGRFDAGVVVWTHETPMNVESATGFDGSDDTAGEQIKDWNVLGSGIGARLNYQFPGMFSVFGEVGSAQMDVKEKDVADPNQDLETLGLNDDFYFVLGVRAGGNFNHGGRAFWSAGIASTSISANVDEDVIVSIQYVTFDGKMGVNYRNVGFSADYDETIMTIDGKVGFKHRNVGYYAGLRFVRSSLDLEETDLTQPAGQQVRMTEFDRDGVLDLALGAKGKGENVAGFVELAVVGTRALTTGMSFRF